MMLENQQAKCFEVQRQLKNLKREKETIEGDQGKLAKDSLTVKLVISV